MKAEIKADGTLQITGETDLECFALECWIEKYGRGGLDDSKVVFSWCVGGDD